MCSGGGDRGKCGGGDKECGDRSDDFDDKCSQENCFDDGGLP